MTELLPESKKLKGLVITIVALSFLLIVSIVAIWLLGPAIQNLFISIGAQITALGAAHQGSQMMADRSPNYNPPVSPPVVPTGNGMNV